MSWLWWWIFVDIVFATPTGMFQTEFACIFSWHSTIRQFTYCGMLQLVTNRILFMCWVVVLRAFHWQAVIINNTFYKCSTIKPQQLWGILYLWKLWGFCTISGFLTCTIHAFKQCSIVRQYHHPKLYIYIYTHTDTHRWHYVTLLEVSPHKPSRAANKLQALLLISICELWVLFVPTSYYTECSYIKPPKAFKMTSFCLQGNFNSC